MDLSLAGPAHRAIASVKMSSCAGPDGALASRPRREAACCSHSGFLTGQCNNALVVRRRTTGLRSHGNWRCRGLWNFLSKNLNLGGNSKFGSDTGGVIKCEKKEEELQDEVPGLSLDNGSALPSLPPVKAKASPVSSQAAADGVPSSPASVPCPRAAEKSNRAGLRRTPITGGVQSATSSHDLPHPSVAVRNLIEQARYAHLCTIMSRMHHRRRGYPFGSLVDFATDATGHPIFYLSPLAIHTRNLLADPRVTLVVQMPGWSGLANARVTLFGDVYPLPPEEQERAHKCFTTKHQHGASQRWGNFYYYRMECISDIYFVGGFGTVAWVDVKEYQNAAPDHIATADGEKTLQELNTQFSKPLKDLLSLESEVDDAALISIDSKGIDIRVRQGAQFNVQRLSFDERNAVTTLDQAQKALVKVLEKSSKRHG